MRTAGGRPPREPVKVWTLAPTAVEAAEVAAGDVDAATVATGLETATADDEVETNALLKASAAACPVCELAAASALVQVEMAAALALHSEES